MEARGEMPDASGPQQRPLVPEMRGELENTVFGGAQKGLHAYVVAEMPVSDVKLPDRRSYRRVENRLFKTPSRDGGKISDPVEVVFCGRVLSLHRIQDKPREETK